ncbi:MAG: insulinase family protein, partial [Muribaculum sp.]|nr:insulinase family protein [Muribaculum sp.]
MSDSKYTYVSLSNGLKTVHVPHDSDVEYCGVAIRAGARNDGTPATFGLAHFVEHTIFKGTAKRRSWHIINRMEAVGGELNAYTSEETTVIYSVFPKGNLTRATELLADLVFNSIFPTIQIDREREVILDEIDSYLDSPSESIFDDFNELIFSGSPLGHNILGTTSSVENISSDDCKAFLRRYYRPDNMVFFYQGPMPPESVERNVSRYFSTASAGQPTDNTIYPPSDVEPFDITRHGTTHQAHTVMGTRTGSMFCNERPALLLFNNIIGGPGMNSLLNVALRERHGYVYTVDSAMTLFSDCGLFTIYFGCDPQNTAKCRRLV